MKLKTSWSEALLLWPQVFKSAWAWAFVSLLIQSLVEIFLSIAQKDQGEPFLIAAMGVSLTVQLLMSAFSIMIFNQMSHNAKHGAQVPMGKAVTDNFKYVLIETTRAFLPIILRFFLFIIPGLVEGIRLYFVPYIVQFDPDYKLGKLDALEGSRALLWAISSNKSKSLGIMILNPLFPILMGFPITTRVEVLNAFLPGAYPADVDWIRPPHIHFKVTRLGFHELITQMYFAGNAYNAKDRILMSLPPQQRQGVVIPLEAPRPGIDPAEPDSKICRFNLAIRRAVSVP